jgi:hypothetical protein
MILKDEECVKETNLSIIEKQASKIVIEETRKKLFVNFFKNENFFYIKEISKKVIESLGYKVKKIDVSNVDDEYIFDVIFYFNENEGHFITIHYLKNLDYFKDYRDYYYTKEHTILEAILFSHYSNKQKLKNNFFNKYGK